MMARHNAGKLHAAASSMLTRALVGGPHQHILSLHFHIPLRMTERLTHLVLSCSHVELPAVPRTGDDVTIERSFS
jgi:hypothetical protein